jgi:hypothetical protein
MIDQQTCDYGVPCGFTTGVHAVCRDGAWTWNVIACTQ